MSRERTRPEVLHHSSSQSESLIDDADSQEGYDHEPRADAIDWGSHDEIDPSESASVTVDNRGRSYNTHEPSRHHSVQDPRQPTRYYLGTAPTPPAVSQPADYLPAMSSQDSDFYSPHAPPMAGYPYDIRSGAYPQSPAGGQYAPPLHHGYGGHMVHWGGQSSRAFQPHAGYFDGARRDMMQYQAPGYPVPYSSPGAHTANYGLPHHINHMIYPAPAPPATEVGGPVRGTTPAPPEEKRPDPEFLKLKEQLEQMQIAQKAKAEQEAEEKLRQRIHEEAERKIKDRLEATRLANEAAKKEIELARIAADAAARERLEEARKAEDERRRLEAELRAQAAREERERIEAERKAEAQRAAEQAAALEKAERDAREKYEAAKRAEEEQAAEMARQKELIEIETKNKLLAEQKAAEEAKAAAELKAAEAAKQLEIEREMLRQKAIQEHEAKLAAEKKVLADAEQAAAAAKQQAHDEFVLKQAEEKRKAEEDAAAAEAAKKAAEELRARTLEEGKKAAADEAKKNGDDKDPINFKDALARKYSIPWYLASEWRNMEGLINQAFESIEDLRAPVTHGRYDLEGPDGALIIKHLWKETIKPGWQISMKLWPPDQGAMPARFAANMAPHERVAWAHNPGRRGHGAGRAPRDPRMAAGGVPPPPPPMGRPMDQPMGQPMGRAPGLFGEFVGPGGHGPMPANVRVVDGARPRDRNHRRTQRPSLWTAFLGGPAKRPGPSRRTRPTT